MGFFKSKQFASVVELEESNNQGTLFQKFENVEIKKGSKLIIRPGQKAILIYNGTVEGMFDDPGSFDVESDIVPFLSTLKGIRFGFDSGERVEVIFVNAKEISSLWGTQQPVYLQDQRFPGGIPVRMNGNFVIKVADYNKLMNTIAGVRINFTVEDVKERILSKLAPLVMESVSKAQDFMYLQTHSRDVSNEIRTKLDAEFYMNGLAITDFNIMHVSYPQEIQNMITKVASQGMIGNNMNTYQQVAMADAISNGGNSAAGQMAGMAAGMAAGMNMADQILNGMGSGPRPRIGGMGAGASTGAYPKFCPNCGKPTDGSKFCPECGYKLS